MTDQSDFELDGEQLSAICQELERVFGHLSPADRIAGLDFALTVGSPDDAVALFRALPDGIRWEELPTYAAAYEQRRKERP